MTCIDCVQVSLTLGWIHRYLFYIEGAITVAGGIVIAFILPNFPATASFLTEEERYWAVRRLVDDSGRVDEHVEGEKWFGKHIVKISRDTID